MKFVVFSLLLLTFGACASKQAEVSPAATTAQVEQAAVKSEAAYGGNCGMGLCLKKKVKGDEKFSVDYKGKHYIFSSAEARDNFVSKIDANIKKADAEWARNSGADKM